MSTKIPVHQAKTMDEQANDLLVASGRYMRSEISMDELERIQRNHAQDIRAAMLGHARSKRRWSLLKRLR